MNKKIIIGISGASGISLAVEVMKGFNKEDNWEIYLIITDAAKKTIELEFEKGVNYILSLADVVCDVDDLAHSVSSGTFITEGMIVVPCSMKTVAGIAGGYSENLLLRAADVTIKQGRKLVLVPRETPLSIIHLNNMLKLAEIGVILLPPMISYYNRPQSIKEVTIHIAGKILDEFKINHIGYKRWHKLIDKEI